MISPFALGLLLTCEAFSGDHSSHRIGIRWERQFDEALKKAKASKKPVLVDFWAQWCGWCHRLDRTTYVDPRVVRLAEDFVAVKVNTEAGPREAEIALRYDVSSLPTIAFLSPSGRQLLRLSGFQGPGRFPLALERAKDIAGKVMGWEAALDRNPDDVAALAGLGVHLFEQEFYEDSRDLLGRATKVDADRPAPQRKQTRMLLGIIQHYDKRHAEAETVLKAALALRPPDELDPKIMYILGKTYLSSGRRHEGQALMRQIVESYPQSPVADKARDILNALARDP